jgi:hypothetical protein
MDNNLILKPDDELRIKVCVEQIKKNGMVKIYLCEKFIGGFIFSNKIGKDDYEVLMKIKDIENIINGVKNG